MRERMSTRSPILLGYWQNMYVSDIQNTNWVYEHVNLGIRIYRLGINMLTWYEMQTWYEIVNWVWTG